MQRVCRVKLQQRGDCLREEEPSWLRNFETGARLDRQLYVCTVKQFRIFRAWSINTLAHSPGGKRKTTAWKSSREPSSAFSDGPPGFGSRWFGSASRLLRSRR